MEQALSVTTISSYLKNILDNDQVLYRVKVFGEISSFNISNGITYFGIKDENALLNCVCFTNTQKYNIGDKVIVQGSPNYYIKGGKLSFNVEMIERIGEGELYKNFLMLKEKLSKEGLFDLEKKKPIPLSVKRIGVVSSETGAVIQDIINVATRRNPEIDIVLFPVKVQGLNAEYSIIKGIEYFDTSNVDAVIVARGGGSEEDLLPFNTEVIVRAIAKCSKFVISAVGHETDYSLCDFVSDLRAPTPSAAAEILVKEKKDYFETLNYYYEKLAYLMANKLDAEKNKLFLISDNINRLIDKKLENENVKLAMLIKDINLKNPMIVIEKGYAKLEKDGKKITSVEDISAGESFDAIIKDGKIKAQVKEIIKWITKKKWLN